MGGALALGLHRLGSEFQFCQLHCGPKRSDFTPHTLHPLCKMGETILATNSVGCKLA